MAKRSLKAEKDYEAKKARPGVQFSVRVPDSTAALMDSARGETARAAWVKNLIDRELRRNAK